MPYEKGQRLPAEHASKIGHIDLTKSEFVRKIVEDLGLNEESEDYSQRDMPIISVSDLGSTSLIPMIYGIDGSMQIIEEKGKWPFKRYAFIKTAMLRIDFRSLKKIDKNYPNPFELESLMKKSAIYHYTAFPLRNISYEGLNIYDAIRSIVFKSLKQTLEGEVLETLKWLLYEKWADTKKQLEFFECPHCHGPRATLEYDAEVGPCPMCGREIFITDCLGFHQDMNQDIARDSIIGTYMIIHETLLMLTGVRLLWDRNKSVLEDSLFIKDGPLSIRAQYSKLVQPIRRFLSQARSCGIVVNILGQEKTGAFRDHFDMISPSIEAGHAFIPSSSYIIREIQGRSETGAPYGKDTNYGAKIFYKFNNYHKMVLNIPTGDYLSDPKENDLIGFERIMATLPSIISNRFEGAIYPIELANGIASLSSYPSAKVLELFASDLRRGT
ncbi:hypothetical protein [Mesotoga sp. UBA5825]|uniref:hypothetical protein n=1 Tax=Mesotoga sp. UBA5825 TaxID=1946858 RepID=UPI0025EBB510|nr:hypothetical protein [Mesotoga sp. UBA5825]